MPIFDQGYQHWQGQLSGHWGRWWTITRYGVRAQLKNRWTRIVTLLAFVPAVGLVLALVLWGLIEQKSDLIMPLLRVIQLPPELTEGPRAFRVPVWTLCYFFFFRIELFLSMILILLVGPGLVSQDLRFNAIPLYLSRPVRRFDYFAGKLGVIGAFLAAVVLAPAVLAYVFGLLFSLDLSVLKDTYHLLIGGVVYGLVIVLSAGMFMLALSSLSRSSRYVAAFWVGIWIVTNTVAGILVAVHTVETQRQLQRSQRAAFPDGLYDPHKMAEVQKKLQRVQDEMLEAARSDWRPLLSYTGNLERLAAYLLDTPDAWRKFGELVEGGQRVMRRRGAGPSFGEVLATQHPWYWSAGVLAGLFGVSLWVLTTRVKSLDRLK